MQIAVLLSGCYYVIEQNKQSYKLGCENKPPKVINFITDHLDSISFLFRVKNQYICKAFEKHMWCKVDLWFLFGQNAPLFEVLSASQVWVGPTHAHRLCPCPQHHQLYAAYRTWPGLLSVAASRGLCARKPPEEVA